MESGPARILFVTGKGGTGKSWLSQALARAGAARGDRVALVRARPEDSTTDLQAPPAMQPQARSRAADQPPAPQTAAPRAATSLHSHAYEEITLDEREALESFLVRILRLGFVARRLIDSRTFSAVAAAAPGVRDLITLLAITDLARPAHGLDLVIVDAPATGHSIPLLTAPARIMEIAPVGPVAREARAAREIVGDSERFAPIIVTTAEELAVSEALSLYEELGRAQVAPPQVVVNGVWPSHLQAADAAWLLSASCSEDAVLHLRRHQRQVELIERLEKRVGPCRLLPFSFQEGAPPSAAVHAALADLIEEAGGL